MLQSKWKKKKTIVSDIEQWIEWLQMLLNIHLQNHQNAKKKKTALLCHQDGQNTADYDLKWELPLSLIVNVYPRHVSFIHKFFSFSGPSKRLPDSLFFLSSHLPLLLICLFLYLFSELLQSSIFVLQRMQIRYMIFFPHYVWWKLLSLRDAG